MKRNDLVDVLKGLAILLVLFGHAAQRSQSVIPASPWVTALFSFGQWHMVLFIALSGYLAFGRIPVKPGPWIGRKARMLMVPYAAWSLLYYWIPDPFISKSGGFLAYARAVALYPGNTFWFFYVLFLCYMAIALVSKVGTWSMLPVGLIAVLLPVGVFGVNLFAWYWWWFCLGYLVARFEDRLVSWRWAGWTFSVVAYVVLLRLWPGEAPLAGRIAWGLVGIGVSTALGTLALATPLRAGLLHLGKHTFELYPSEFAFFLIPLPLVWWRIPVHTALAVLGGLVLGEALRRFSITRILFLGDRGPRSVS